MKTTNEWDYIGSRGTWTKKTTGMASNSRYTRVETITVQIIDGTRQPKGLALTNGRDMFLLVPLHEIEAKLREVLSG